MKLILAVSGGADSMTMADIMFSHSRLCPVNCEDFVIAHCNFNLRPGDCDADEDLVREWAARRGIRCFCSSFDTRGYARDQGCSIEVAARELRYRRFIELCNELGFDGTATAHHADDNAETLLLNLLRGTGLHGACGMSMIDRMPYQEDGGGLLLVRPLLGMSRGEIMTYVREHEVPYRDDKSNFENEYKRNRLRNNVIPVLKELNTSFVDTVAADMENFRMAALAVEDWEREQLKSVEHDGEREILGYAALRACASPGQLVMAWLKDKGFSRDNMLKISRMFKSPSVGAKFITEGWTLYTGADAFTLSPRSRTTRHEVRELISAYDGSSTLKTGKGCLILDADRAGDYELRQWKQGDWFVPFGMKGSKKLSDWFTDVKAGEADKHEAVVLAVKGDESGRILAVLCPKACRQDESTRVTSGSVRLLTLKFD